MATNSAVMTQQKPIDRVLNLLNGAKRNNNGWYSVRCPGHNDKNPSLSFMEGNDGGVILHCHAGCTREQIVMGMGLSEHELRPNEQRQRTVSQSPLTIVELAFDKQLPWQLLAQEGITDDCHYKGSTGVRIPYYSVEKEEHTRFRLRLTLRAKEGSFWCGTEGKLIPYGLHRLQQAREAGYLIIAEGESDAWTCWLHNIPCLGIPGATNTGCLDGSALQGIEKLYIMQEPDSAGERFPVNIQQRLEATGYKGKIYALNLHEKLGVKDLNDLHKMDVATFNDTLKPLLEQAKPLFKEAVQESALSAIISANSLMQQDLQPPDYVVQDLLPAGLILLGGKQKIGKSWFNYRLALDVAAGKPFLGNFPTTPGDVLLLSLEDNRHRLQSRYRAIIGNDAEVPTNLELAAEWPRMCNGGLEALEQWITTHANPRLIIIDPWVLVKPYLKTRPGTTMYDADYEALEGVKKLTDKHHICILIIFHLRKMSADDPFDEMNASTGATACGDGFLHLSRKRGETLAKLWGTGRDYPKEINAALKFNDGSWEYQGNADDFPELSPEAGGSYKPSQECQEILDLLGESKQPLMPMEIARRIGKDQNTTRCLLYRMKKREEVKDTRKGYVLIGRNGPNGPNDPNGQAHAPQLFDLWEEKV